MSYVFQCLQEIYKLARALELCNQLSLHKSMEGALKLVNACYALAITSRTDQPSPGGALSASTYMFIDSCLIRFFKFEGQSPVLVSANPSL